MSLSRTSILFGDGGPVEAGCMLRVAGKVGEAAELGGYRDPKSHSESGSSVPSPQRWRDYLPTRGDVPILMTAVEVGLIDLAWVTRLCGVTFCSCPVQAAQASLCMFTCM